MAWRSVMIRKPARLSLKRGQLCISQENTEHTLPLEDLVALTLESPEISLTSSLLSACHAHGVVVISCDGAHMPCGVMHPFHQHSRNAHVAAMQMLWSEPLRKRLWQRIVKSKITNQAACLEQQGIAAKRLHTLAASVQSGDPKNMEAQAARYYWIALFGKDFTRGSDHIINAALNYGYAVVRAIVARSQVAYGLLPCFGIHHANALNSFNLSDDVMEVFRPFVDALVVTLVEEAVIEAEENRLGKEARARLAAIGSADCMIAGNVQSIINAADVMSTSLVNAIDGKSAALLHCPQWRNGQDSVA